MPRPALHRPDPGTKTCKVCGVAKDTAEFSYKPHGVLNCQTVCKACDRVRQARQFQEWKTTGQYREFRRKQTLREYGMTPAEYAALLHEQSGVCAICGRPPEDGKSLCVDHDHGTGRVRGLLCKPCNLVIGNAQDCPKRLQSAIEYLASRTDVTSER